MATKRFTRDNRCPICNGYDGQERGAGRRCYGFLADNGLYAHCTREEMSGGLPKVTKSESYAHKLVGDCDCGTRHDPEPVDHDKVVYDYKDSTGNTVFQVVRIKNPKGFFQRRPDGKGGWINNLQGVDRVLYNQNFLTSPEFSKVTVFVVEGEKDADALNALGYLATTNAGGAGKWKDQYSNVLTGRNVIIIPDNDKVGLEHAETVYNSLAGKAKFVRIVKLPDVGDKGDISDWLDQHHHRTTEFDALIQNESLYWTPTVGSELPELKVVNEETKVENKNSELSSPAAEETVIKAIFADNDLMPEAQGILKPESFTEKRAEVFAGMMRLYDKGQPISSVMLNNIDPKLDLTYLSQFSTIDKPVTSVKPYAEIVIDKARKRTLRTTLLRVAENVDKDSFQNVLTQLDTAVEPQRNYESSFGFKTFEQLSSEAHVEVEDMRKGVSHAIPTGLKTLDKAMRGGGRPKQFHLWSALTGRGKSAFAKQLAHNVASNGYPVAIITAEMADIEFFFRMLSPEAKVPVFQIDIGLPESDYDHLEWSIPKIGKLPIWIDDHTIDVFNIKANLRSLFRKHPSDKPWVVIVDYLQLLKVTSEQFTKMVMSRANEVAVGARTMKNVSKELDCWVVGLSQFNREGAKRDEEGNQNPEIHQLAESSELENASDLVGIIDMDDYVMGEPERDARFTIAKYRHGIGGRTVTLPFIFNGPYMEFRDVIETNPQPEPGNVPQTAKRKDTRTTQMFEPDEPHTDQF